MNENPSCCGNVTIRRSDALLGFSLQTNSNLSPPISIGLTYDTACRLDARIDSRRTGRWLGPTDCREDEKGPRSDDKCLPVSRIAARFSVRRKRSGNEDQTICQGFWL